MDSEAATLDRPDPDARIPDVPAFRHVLISEPDLGMLYIGPHLPGMHPEGECRMLARAFATFVESPDTPSTTPIPAGRWYCFVDDLGLFELGGRCLP